MAGYSEIRHTMFMGDLAYESRRNLDEEIDIVRGQLRVSHGERWNELRARLNELEARRDSMPLPAFAGL